MMKNNDVAIMPYQLGVNKNCNIIPNWTCEDIVIDFGLRVKLTDEDIQEFKLNYGDASILQHCVMCSTDIQKTGGDFVLETLRSKDTGNKMKRPRIICEECSEVHSWKLGKDRRLSNSVFPIMKVFFTLTESLTRSVQSSPRHLPSHARHNPALYDQKMMLDKKEYLITGKEETEKDHDKDAFNRKSYKDIIGAQTSPTQSSNDHDNIPFLETLQVVTNSCAYNAGLRQGDLFLKFGPFTKKNFPGLVGMWDYINSHANSPIECTIGRRLTGGEGGSLPRVRVKRNLILKPKQWTHGVCLGFVVNTFPAPSPRH